MFKPILDTFMREGERLAKLFDFHQTVGASGLTSKGFCDDACKFMQCSGTIFLAIFIRRNNGVEYLYVKWPI
jgi:hypothetical protein